jgi:hypothetical protein
MRKSLLAVLALGSVVSGACVVIPNQPWEDRLSVFPFVWGFPFGLFGLSIYLLPTIVVFARRKKNVIGPILVNVLLGWTVVGWIVALLWACLVKE